MAIKILKPTTKLANRIYQTAWRNRLIFIAIFVIGLASRSTHLTQAIDTELWREDDVSTIALNFFRNNTDIFHPQIAWDGNGPGYTESEFPLYPYMIALSYKTFGFWEGTGRVISLIFSLATMLVFFKLSNYLLNKKAAITSSFFFAISPLLCIISDSVRPEPIMFFFYVCSAYTFIRWLTSSSKKFYVLAILSTALALLCKIPAANIGILFILLAVRKKNWKFLFNPQVLILGAFSTIPSIFWYMYSHKFYVLYGNSLGLSNEYAWIGWDFFTTRHFIKGVIMNELENVWTLAGPLIVILALIFTKLIKKESTIIALYWFAAALFFYVLAVRATSEEWAYYYHIFSVPSVSLLVGASVIELHEKFYIGLNSSKSAAINRPIILKHRMIILLLFVLIFCFVISSFQYIIKSKKPYEFQTSQFYSCKDSLQKIIPANSLLLVNGATQGTQKYPHAYNNSYFFYWLDRKGYNISIEDQTIKSVLQFKEKGVSYFLAEERVLILTPGFEDQLKRNFKTIFECNGCILFKL